MAQDSESVKMPDPKVEAGRTAYYVMPFPMMDLDERDRIEAQIAKDNRSLMARTLRAAAAECRERWKQHCEGNFDIELERIASEIEKGA